MFDNLTALAYGIIVFAVLIGVGIVVLYNFGNSVGGSANTAVQYLVGQMGQSGLAGWTPAIIAISVGMLFLGMFMLNGGGRSGGRRSRKRR